MKLKSRKLLIITVLLASTLLIKPVHRAMLNYDGVCADTGQRGDDRLKVERAIKKLFVYYPKSAVDLQRWFSYPYYPYLPSSQIPQPGSVPIPYQNIAEFTSLNPDCCRVSAQPNNNENAPATILDRIMGTKAAFVEIRFQLRYTTPDGTVKPLQQRVTYAITNCGVVWNDN